MYLPIRLSFPQKSGLRQLGPEVADNAVSRTKTQIRIVGRRDCFRFLLLILPLAVSNAQIPAAKPTEPEAIGVAYHLDASGQTAKALPDEEWKQKSGLNGYTSYIEVSGRSSSFRIRSSDGTAFVFKAGSPEKVALYQFDQKWKNRQFTVGKIASYLTGGTTLVKGLPVEVTKYGESSFKLTPASQLAPGEYAISIAGELFTFGVDQ